MMVELRLRGAADRLVRVVFEGFDVAIDGSDTVIRGEARDEIDALGLIERATNVGFVVASWRVVDSSSAPD